MTGIIILTIAVGAIWAVLLMLRAPLLISVLATVLVAAVFSHGFPSLSIAGTRWTIDRFMLLWLVAAFIVHRQQGRLDIKSVGLSEWLQLAFLGWLSISLFLHDYRLNFGNTATPIWRWSTAYCIPAIMYWFARQSSYGERQAGWLQTALILFGLYLAFTGICEVMKLWALVFPKTIADPMIGIHFGRARGPMFSSVSYGLYLGVGTICLWATRDRLGRLVWFILPPLTLLCFAGLYYSYTRSTWIGTGLGLLIVLAFTMHGRARIMTVGGFALCAVLLLASKMDNILFFQREQSAATAKNSAESRLSFAYVSWKMFEDSPLWGVGFGQFPVAKMPYLMDRVDLPLEDIRGLVHHNTFFSLLTETGIVGFALFVAILISWANHARLLCRDPALPPWIKRLAVLFLGTLGLYICQLAFHELSYSTIDNYLVFMLAGTMMGAHPAWIRSQAPAERFSSVRELNFSTEIQYGQYNLGLK